MTKLQELRESLSAKKAEFAEFLTGEGYDDKKAKEYAQEIKELQNKESYLVEFEPQPEMRAEPESSETRELEKIKEKVSIRDYIKVAAYDGYDLPTEARELQAERGIAQGTAEIPFSLLERRPLQVRADATSTSVPQGRVPEHPTIPRLFPDSVAQRFMQVSFDQVSGGDQKYNVFETGDTPTLLQDKSASKDATAASITTTTIVPKRSTSRYLFQLEDLVVSPALEMDLRNDMSQALSDQIDSKIITDFFGSTIALTADSAPNSVVNWDSAWTSLGTNGTDGGVFAEFDTEVRALVGTDTYKKIATLFRGSGAGADNHITIVDKLRMSLAGIAVNKNVPAMGKTSKIAKSLLIRLGKPTIKRAVVCFWGGLRLIRSDQDPRAQTATISITGHVIHSAVSVLKKDAYRISQLKLS